jgi:hypothetical protein
MPLETIEQPPASVTAGPPGTVWVAIATGLGLLLAGCALWAWPESTALLESTPPGAEVFLDGRSAGQTPLRLASRPLPLRGQLEISLSGYSSWSGTVESGPGENRLINVRLEPLPGRMSVGSSPPGALVRFDGREAGHTPLVLADLPPGRHHMELALAGYQTWRSDLEIQPGGTASQDVTLVRLPPALDPALAKPPMEASVEGRVPEAASGPSASTPGPGPPPALDLSTTIYPLAVMIENAPESRPQSGLASADIVFEAMAEGEISRFMAVYVESDAPIVGPVRSARHYFINLAAELGASVVHVGSSPLGYVSLQWYGLRNLEEIFDSGGFWRSRFRPSPHNAYTSVAAARQALDGRASPGNGSWGGFTFKDPARRYSGTAAPSVSLIYEPWGYRVEYRYDPASNRYARFMEGQPHLDAESRAQLEAASVAVLIVKAWQIDTAARLDMEQLGSGPAAYFVDGVVLEGSWSKRSTTAPTLFLDGAGNPIRFNPGPNWVQLISPEGKVTY